MSDSSIAHHLLNKWSADLRNKDRSWDSVGSNFEELFFELYKNGIPFDEAHELMKQAIAAHLPNLIICKRTWNKCKNLEQYQDATFHEFIATWKKGIHDLGMEAFYSIYKPEETSSKEVLEEEKIFNMSAKEYRMQRRYVESFPIVKTEELEKRLAEGVCNFEEFFKGLDKMVLEKSDDDSKTE